MSSIKPTILGFSFDLLKSVNKKNNVDCYEAFVMGYVSGKYGISSFQNNLPLYERIAVLKNKAAATEDTLLNIYIELTKNHTILAEDMLTKLESVIYPEEVKHSHKEFDNQFGSFISRYKEDLEKKDKELAEKLTEEEKKAEEERKKEEKKKCVCKYCDGFINYDDLVTLLNCDDKYHELCITDYALDEMKKNKIPIECPSCNKEIHHEDLKSLFNKPTFERYNTLVLRKELLNNPDKYLYCPTTNCNYAFEWDKNRDGRFSCPNCKKEYCFNCYCLYHSGLTCAQYKSKNNVYNLFPEGDINRKICPSCDNWPRYHRNYNYTNCSRCNYMFCFNCGSKKTRKSRSNKNRMNHSNNDKIERKRIK